MLLRTSRTTRRSPRWPGSAKPSSGRRGPSATRSNSDGSPFAPASNLLASPPTPVATQGTCSYPGVDLGGRLSSASKQLDGRCPDLTPPPRKGCRQGPSAPAGSGSPCAEGMPLPAARSPSLSRPAQKEAAGSSPGLPLRTGRAGGGGRGHRGPLSGRGAGKAPRMPRPLSTERGGGGGMLPARVGGAPGLQAASPAPAAPAGAPRLLTSLFSGSFGGAAAPSARGPRRSARHSAAAASAPGQPRRRRRPIPAGASAGRGGHPGAARWVPRRARRPRGIRRSGRAAAAAAAAGPAGGFSAPPRPRPPPWTARWKEGCEIFVPTSGAPRARPESARDPMTAAGGGGGEQPEGHPPPPPPPREQAGPAEGERKGFPGWAKARLLTRPQLPLVGASGHCRSAGLDQAKGPPKCRVWFPAVRLRSFWEA